MAKEKKKDVKKSLLAVIIMLVLEIGMFSLIFLGGRALYILFSGEVKEEKMKTGKNIFDGRFSKEFAGFLLVLIQKDRFAESDKTLEYFIGRMKEYKKIGVAYVSTAAALSDVQQEKVNARLLETTDFETVEMNYTVDESLLGGMVIRIGDRVVDTSIKNKLRELSKQLSALQVG